MRQLVSWQIWSRVAAILAVTGILAVSTQPVHAEQTTSVSVGAFGLDNGTMGEAWTWDAAAAASLSAAAAGAASGAVVCALAGTPISAGVGAAAGAIGGFVGGLVGYAASLAFSDSSASSAAGGCGASTNEGIICFGASNGIAVKALD